LDGDGVQTTLLGAAIVIILALVTALVGPLFVDWGSYRGQFEARVGRLTGLEVRVAGPIDVRLLPTPTLTLQQIEFGRRGDPAKTRARELRIELALGSLMSGEWRAPVLRLQAPEFALALDRSGRLDWSTPSIALDRDAVSIEHLEIEDGRATLADAASGSQLSLDQLNFTGQVRSLNGPVKGEGSFAFDGKRFPYRLAVGRAGDDGAVKVRLNVVPLENQRKVDVDQRNVDIEGSVWIERGVPRFDGTLQWARRPAEGSPDGEPWRITSHLRLDSTTAKLDQIELQYGPEERAVRLRGDASLSFGPKPVLDANLTSSQIDLDRMLARPEAAGRRPLVAIRTVAESLVQVRQLPVGVKLKIKVDAVTLAGSVLYGVEGDVSSEGEAWDITRFLLRAPGLTQVELRGRLGAAPNGVAFEGWSQIASTDPRSLFSWLADRNVQLATSGPLRLEGNIALGSEKIVFDRLQAVLDRMKIEGRLDYSWPAGDQPAKLNAALRAPELDLDRVQQVLTASLGELALEWPREGTLAIDVGRTIGSGIEAKDVSIKMRRDPGAFEIERLTVGDLGGAKLTAGGRIDTRGAIPRGTMSLDLEARSLDGTAALIERFSPPVADRIRRAAGRSAPVKLHASLALDREAATGAAAGSSLTTLKLAGSAGTFRIDLQGEAAGGGVLDPTDLAKLGGSKVHLAGQVEAGDGSTLVDMLGLDRLVSVSQRSGRLSLDMKGPLDGEMAVKAQLSAGGLDVSANGTAHLSGSQGPSAQLALRAAAANVEAFRFAVSRRTAQLPWTTLTARLTLDDDAITLADLNGTAAGVAVKGRFGLGLTRPLRMTGDITVAAVDLPAAIGTAIGFPRQNGAGDGAWPGEPFESGLLGAISGRITVNAGQVGLTSKLAARDVRAVLDFDPSGITIADIDGAFAGGRVSGNLAFERGDEGMTARSQVRFTGTDAAELLGGGGRSPLSGKLTVDLDVAGAGRSPFALIGSLKGGGRIAWQDGSIARLGPSAFDVMTRLADQDFDANRFPNRMEAALSAGQLPVALAEGSIAVDMGQLSLVDPVVHAKGAEFGFAAATVDLLQSVIDVRMILSAPNAPDPVGGNRPEIAISLKGPIDAPKRTLDASKLANWLSQRAADQKAKRAEALEQAAREHAINAGEATTTGTAESEPTAPARPNPNVPAGPPRQRPMPGQPAAAIVGQDGKTGDEPRVRRTAPAVDPAPLPPPLDLRPPSVPHGPRG
jgi:uncharacterized protein involved in outer membrane biogenesis